MQGESGDRAAALVSPMIVEQPRQSTKRSMTSKQTQCEAEAKETQAVTAPPQSTSDDVLHHLEGEIARLATENTYLTQRLSVSPQGRSATPRSGSHTLHGNWGAVVPCRAVCANKARRTDMRTRALCVCVCVCVRLLLTQILWPACGFSQPHTQNMMQIPVNAPV